MNITRHTKISELIEKYPFLIEELEKVNSKFSLLKNKVARATMGKVATVTMAATVGGMKPEDLIADLQKIVEAHKAEPIEYDSQEEQKRLDQLKSIIRQMHKEENNEEARKRFNDLLKDIDPDEIKTMEQQLVMEGMPVKEVQRLCELHVGVFKDALGGHEEVTVPSGHPVHSYQQENRQIENVIEKIECLIETLDSNPEQNLKEIEEELVPAIEQLASIALHYTRKENQLFPFMEKHGITAPPQVMWGVHDEIRSLIKLVKEILVKKDAPQLHKKLVELMHAITEMIFKEEKILFPMVLQNLTNEEWSQVRKGEDELGYILDVKPGMDWEPAMEAVPETVGESLPLQTGKMTLQQINAMLKHLPLDISFVDVNDEVAYYSETEERLFPRTPAVIGRKVQNCHPPQSVNIVQEILDEFRAGRKKTADFWITMHGKDLYIRYFAVQDDCGNYMGTLEVTQDITAIKKLEGQKRLLDWEK